MKYSLSTLLAFGVLSLAGCKSTPPPVTYAPTIFPSIGTTATAGIGEPLLTKGDGKIIAAIEIPSDQTIGDLIIHKGKYEQTRQNSEYITFGAVSMTNKAGARLNREDLFLFSKDTDGKTLCTSRKNCASINFTKTSITRSETASYQQTLFYNGKIGNRINLAYREFSNNVARPAFSNEVSYDLSESTILGYKGARIEIIQATNTELTYKILAAFN